MLREARSVFERLGYHATRVDDIVAAAGLAHGTFYRYFASKEEAFRVVATEAQQRIRAGQPLTLHSEYAPDVAEHGMRTYLAEFRDDARMIELLEEAATYDPEVRQARLDLRARMSATTAQWITILRDRGEVDADLDVEYVSALIGAMVDRFAYTWFVFGREFEAERAIKQLRDAWLRIVGWHEPHDDPDAPPTRISDIPLQGPTPPERPASA